MTDAFVAKNVVSRFGLMQNQSSANSRVRAAQGSASASGPWALAARALLVVSGLASAAVAGASGASAQGTVKQQFGDWQQRCERPAGASVDQCALVQNVAASDRPNVTLLVIILNTADGKGRLLRVLAPLGVLLPAGLGLKIDQSDVGRAGFVRCLTTGCVAEVVMDDNLVTRLKAGKVGTFVVFQTPEEGIGVPVSLTGLDKGLEALK